MKKWNLTGLALACAGAICSGCVSVNVSDHQPVQEERGEGSRELLKKTVRGIAVDVVREGDNVLVSLTAQGDFSWEDKEKYVTAAVIDTYLSVGFFPGVMGCKGEIAKALPNGAGAFWYNIVFCGVPTVYGLVVAPFIPVAQEQKESVFGRDAFVLSSLMGFYYYSKNTPGTEHVQTKVGGSNVYKLPEAELRLASGRYANSFGGVLRCSKTDFDSNGLCALTFTVPPGHPLKDELRPFENKRIYAKLEK